MAVKFDKYDKFGAIHWNMSNRFALRYNPALVSRYQSVIKMIPKECKKALDIGCGDGRLTFLIAKNAPRAEVYGIDSELRGIEKARQLTEQRGSGDIKFLLNSEDHLPFADEHFDFVVMTDVIEHLSSPQQMMSEIRRILTTDGTCIITTPNRQAGSKWDVRHEHEFDGPELASLMNNYFQESHLSGSWKMTTFRWGSKGLGRLTLNLLSRLGIDLLGRSVKNPSSDWGQLTAYGKGPKFQ